MKIISFWFKFDRSHHIIKSIFERGKLFVLWWNVKFCKIEICIVSKKYLENIVSKLNSKLQYNQWKNTSTVIKWFKAIQNKAKCRFIKFDIAEFYPSISVELLERPVSFAKSLIDTEGNIINTINHARKSLLFDDSGA